MINIYSYLSSYKVIYTPDSSRSNFGCSSSRHSSRERDYSVESARRAVSKFKTLACTTSFDYFGTITFGSNFNRFDYDKTIKLLQKKFYQLSSRFPEFKYLYVVEYHSDGAFHLHGLFSFPRSFFKLRSVDRSGRVFYSSLLNRLFGRNSFSKIKGLFHKAVDYCCKYILKAPVKISQYYFHSSNVRRDPVFSVDGSDCLKFLVCLRHFFSSKICTYKFFTCCYLTPSEFSFLRDNFLWFWDFLNPFSGDYAEIMPVCSSGEQISLF